MLPALEALDHAAITAWLKETDEHVLEALWARADEVRRVHVGDEVHLRGLVEITNYCVRQCAYCGIAACAGPLPRYRMTHDEILACARQGRDLGFGTIVLQGGEDPGTTGAFVDGVVRAIKDETGAAITLSLGEPGQTATSCDSRPPIRISTAASIRACPARCRTASAS
ncbi:MAG: hypothetical protein NTY02_01000 [Acidobacteria bacterium]|nr:hypothetical protein [Acidobacteriota bacterium]